MAEFNLGRCALGCESHSGPVERTEASGTRAVTLNRGRVACSRGEGGTGMSQQGHGLGWDGEPPHVACPKGASLSLVRGERSMFTVRGSVVCVIMGVLLIALVMAGCNSASGGSSAKPQVPVAHSVVELTLSNLPPGWTDTPGGGVPPSTISGGTITANGAWDYAAEDVGLGETLYSFGSPADAAAQASNLLVNDPASNAYPQDFSTMNFPGIAADKVVAFSGEDPGGNQWYLIAVQDGSTLAIFSMGGADATLLQSAVQAVTS